MTITRMRCHHKDMARILGPHFTLTRHFVQNWRKRVGNEVHIDAVRAVLKQSVVVQQGRRLMNGQGDDVHTLSWYWHPAMQLMISVDRYQNTAVSVLTGANAPRPRNGLRELIRLINGKRTDRGDGSGTIELWRRYGMKANGGRI